MPCAITVFKDLVRFVKRFYSFLRMASCSMVGFLLRCSGRFALVGCGMVYGEYALISASSEVERRLVQLLHKASVY